MRGWQEEGGAERGSPGGRSGRGQGCDVAGRAPYKKKGATAGGRSDAVRWRPTPDVVLFVPPTTATCGLGFGFVLLAEPRRHHRHRVVDRVADLQLGIPRRPVRLFCGRRGESEERAFRNRDDGGAR